MLGWSLYMKRRNVKPEEFLEGCSNLEQAKQRFDSKKIKAPNDAIILQYLEDMSNAASNSNFVKVSIEDKVTPSKELIFVSSSVDSFESPEESTITSEINSLSKQKKGRKKKQLIDSEELKEEEDEQK
jgi:hypothetical protein